MRRASMMIGDGVIRRYRYSVRCNLFPLFLKPYRDFIQVRFCRDTLHTPKMESKDRAYR